MKDDAISRQAVLKLLSTIPPEEAMTKALLIQSVKQMDAPDNLVKDSQVLAKDLANDTISRKAALDALEWKWAGKAAFDAIKALPSAQQERTCVNCGRTANNGGWYADGGTRCPIEEHYALPKDGFCHLWEKRNVTDDDYPERRTDESNMRDK